MSDRPRAFLRRRNPLATIAGPLPAMVLLVLTRDPWTPAAFVVVAFALLLVGSGRPRRTLLLGAAKAVPALAVAAVLLALVAAHNTARGGSTLLAAGPIALTTGGLGYGAATALRLAALVTLVLVGGLTADGPELARALTAHLRLPYRIGYTALAAYRFVPRFRSSAATLAEAQRIRGLPEPRGVVGRARAVSRGAVPLLADGVRHAERVAMAMDARGFGAYPTRTERHPVRFTRADAGFVLGCWLVSAVIVVASARAGLLHLSFAEL